MTKTKNYYKNLLIYAAMTAFLLWALLATCYMAYDMHQTQQLINQETIAAEKFKTSAAYHKQQGRLEAYADMVEAVGKLSYNPAFVAPPRKPE